MKINNSYYSLNGSPVPPCPAGLFISPLRLLHLDVEPDALLGSLPGAEWLIADRGYNADWFREALKNKGIKPCILGRKSRGKAVRYDKRRYKRRNRIEIMFGRLKDWRRVATRHDRCSKTFLSAVALAATVLFWL